MLVDCYKRHNKSVFKITGDIFDGDYGSEVENRLENEFYSLLDKKERIQVAKVKWSNARLLLDHAVRQIGVACSKWSSLKHIPSTYAILFTRQLKCLATNNKLIPQKCSQICVFNIFISFCKYTHTHICIYIYTYTYTYMTK